MTGEQYLTLLEEKRLLPPELVAALRLEMAESEKEIPPRAVAKLLVDRGELTQYQAKQLLEEGARLSDEPADELPEGLTLIEDEPELGLQEDEPPASAPAPAKTPSSPGAAPATSKPTAPPAAAPPAPRPAAPITAAPKPAAPPAPVVPASPSSQPPRWKAPPAQGPAEPSPPPKPARETPAPKPSTAARPVTARPVSSPEPVAPAAMGGPLDNLLADPSLFDASFGSQGDPLAKPAPKKKGWFGWLRPAPVDPKAPPKSEWESPLVFLAGGALLLLLVIGAVALFYHYRGGGDRQLSLAEEDYKAGSYGPAIEKYQTYLSSYSSHPGVSTARVHSGLARLRQALESSSDASQALELAREVLPEVEQEEAFADAQPEVTAILVEMAEDLAKQAEAATDVAEARERVAHCEQAIEMLHNPGFVPKSTRPVERIERMRDKLSVVNRRLDRDVKLTAALAAMKTATAASKTAEAYAARKQLLKLYPELVWHEGLVAAVAEIVQGELGQTQVVEEKVAAVSEDRKLPVLAQITLANRSGGNAPSAAGHVAVVTAGGAACALNAEDGSVLWRRFLGFDFPLRPQPVSSAAGSDFLLADTARDEIVRVKSQSGDVVWRQPIGERFAQPLLYEDRVLAATRDGRVLEIDAATGARTRHAVLPQALRTGPSSHSSTRCLYQLGEQASLYVLGADDLACKEVVHVGHEPGTAPVPPVALTRHVIVAENWGVNLCTLHVFVTDAQGLGLKPVQQIRLRGHVLTPPVAFERKLAVITDQGEIKIFLVGLATDEQPLTVGDEKAAVAGQPVIRYPLFAGGALWVGGQGIVKYAVQPRSGKISPQGIDDSFSAAVFDGPIQQAGDILIHPLRRAGSAALSVVATEPATGRTVWQTELGAPPAAGPMLAAPGKEVAVLSQAGALFDLGAQGTSRVVNQALAAEPSGDSVILTGGVQLDGGRWAYISDKGRLLIVHPAGSPTRLQWLKTEPLACLPTRFGAGLLAPTTPGTVFWLDAATGDSLCEPFQPRLEAGQKWSWQPAEVVVDGEEFVISDGLIGLYHVAVRDRPARHLTALATSNDVPEPLKSPLAVLKASVLAADGNGSLLSFVAPQLKLSTTLPLSGQVTWGPKRVGDAVLLVTDAGDLVCIGEGPQERWRRPLAHGPLAGDPVATGDSLLFASQEGVVYRVAAATGDEIAQVDVEQPLAAGPVLDGQRVLLATHDGAVLVINAP